MRALLAAARAVLERRAAEIRFGTDLMRTVHLDDVVSQLRAGAGSSEAVERVAEIALALMKAGVGPEDVEALLYARHHAKLIERLGLTTEDVVLAAQARPLYRQRAGTGG